MREYLNIVEQLFEGQLPDAARPNDQILDLNDDAEDVKGMSAPHRHDKKFWNNPDHRESMKSCLPRVEKWLNEFEAELSQS